LKVVKFIGSFHATFHLKFDLSKHSKVGFEPWPKIDLQNMSKGLIIHTRLNVLGQN